MKIKNIDHLVLTVSDINKTIQFYTRILGMQSETFGNGRIALKFGQQKINLHLYGHEFEPKANQSSPGSADLCFIIDNDLAQTMAEVKNNGIEILEGPVQRTGASGAISSFYFRDPDGNLIEIASYQ